MKYLIDFKTNILHREDCPNFNGDGIVWQGLHLRFLENGTKKKFCECCQKDYRAFVRADNEKLIANSNWNFVYTSGSKIFHKKTCSCVYYSRELHGVVRYKKMIDKGFKACKLCKPQPIINAKKISDKSPKLCERKKGRKKDMPNNFRKAYTRFEQAKTEREKKMLTVTTEMEHQDLLTLTQPHFAFWAARGYETFHLRQCPKLRGKTNLIGFSKYQDARAKRYKPCKTCQPTPKSNLYVSIPYKSSKKEGEDVTFLKEKCEKEGYAFEQDEKFCYIKTAVGSWKIKLTTMPIRVYHQHLTGHANQLHLQHKTFLSFSDVFSYIRKHDNVLKKKMYVVKV